MTEWDDLLATGKKGLAVEGADDRKIIEVFLNAGAIELLWSDWRPQLEIVAVGGINTLLDDLAAYQGEVWGIIDRDWRSDDQITELQLEYPNLLVLPRVMIENYLIAPDELLEMLKHISLSPDQVRKIYDAVEAERDLWLRHGALWQTLYQHDADHFCHPKRGFPDELKSFKGSPPKSEASISSFLEKWHSKLKPEQILADYRTHIEAYQKLNTNVYKLGLHGKMFFNQVIVKSLNVHVKQKDAKDSDVWLERLLKGIASCPDDLIPLLKTIVS